MGSKFGIGILTDELDRGLKAEARAIRREALEEAAKEVERVAREEFEAGGRGDVSAEGYEQEALSVAAKRIRDL